MDGMDGLDLRNKEETQRGVRREEARLFSTVDLPSDRLAGGKRRRFQRA